MINDVGVVLIGRNEGHRLLRALHTAVAQGVSIVYVDSASTDGSIDAANNMGVKVIELDMRQPFSAARARNEGRKLLNSISPSLRYVQFIDGDCELDRYWLTTAYQALENNTKLAAVCGRRRERYPMASVYNRLIDFEWDTPIGPVQSCGGDGLYRLEAFDAVGGFDPSVVAGEEPELCRRIRAAGWQLMRIDAEMTLHDADMHHFKQWWRREIRSGYGAFDVFRRTRHADPLFTSHVWRARIWTLGWLVLIFLALVISIFESWSWIAVALLALTWPVQILRVARRYEKRGAVSGEALMLGGLNMIGKWAQLIGQYQLLRDTAMRGGPQLIEYKINSAER